MSGISSIGGYNSDAYYRQLEQQALAQQDAAAADSNAAASAQAAATTAASTPSSSTPTTLKDKIRAAIMSAVHEAENSGGNTDLVSIIRAAVDKALQDAGIDPSTAQDSDQVDSSTKSLLTALDSQAKVEAETMNILSSLDSAAGTNASSPIDLLSQLANPSGSSQSNQNLLGYLLDTQQ
jgi:hypothetical protein